MERLTEKGKSGYFVRPHKGGATMIYAPGKEVQQRYEGEIIDRLAHYEDLEEQGRLVVLPSAIGGKVYRIVAIECEDCPSYDGKTPLRDWTCDQDKCPQKIVEDRFDMWMLKMVGRLVFASRAEAEAALTPASDVPEGE